MPGDLVMQLAYAHNARLGQAFWPDLRLGELAEGAAADLVSGLSATTPLGRRQSALAPASLAWRHRDNRHVCAGER